MITGRAGLLLLALVVCACAGDDDRASDETGGPVVTGSLSDAQVGALVALINGTEIASGKAVEPKLATPAARTLAAALVADHTRLAEAMPDVRGPRVSPPQAHSLAAVLHSHAAMLSTLPAGYAFDATVAATQVVGHVMAIDSLVRWREVARDGELRRALGAALPVMESHLAQARALYAGLNRGGGDTRGDPAGDRAAPDTLRTDTLRTFGAESDTLQAGPTARDTAERGG